MNEKISSRQAILLIMICRIVTILTIMPTIYIEPANQDTWIVIIVSGFYTILTSIPALFLSSRFNELNFIGYIKKIFGKIIGKIIGFIYILFYLRTTILYCYISIQMIRSTFLPDTKASITIIFLIVSCIYIASQGPIVLGRYTELFVPIILFFMLMFIFLGYKNIELNVLLPVYKDSTFWKINYGAIKLTYLFVDLSVLLMIGHKLEEPKERWTIFVKSIIYSLVFILATVIVTQGALGVEQSKHSNFPFLAYIRLISSYSIFERVESIYILLWVFAMVIKITAYLNITNEGVKEIFKHKSKNLFLYTIGFFCILITFYFAEINPKSTEIINIKDLEYVYYFIHKTLIPLIAVLVYFIRRKTFESEEKLQG
jgi:spore germination protein (amino acid permease)